MSTPAGWYPDPTGRHQHRYFDGDDWTDSVADGQAVSSDPVKGGGPAAGGAGAGATQVISVPPQQPPAPGQSTPPTQGTPAASLPPTHPTPAAGVAGGAPPGAPLGNYAGPPGGPGPGGKSKTGLIIGIVVVLIAVAVGVVLLTQGGDDDGGETASEPSEDASDDPEEEEDPELTDLFDPMGEGAVDDADDDDEPVDEPDTTEPADEPDTTEPDNGGGDEYPQEAIDGFNQSCTASGGPVDFCQCIIDVLERDVPYDRLLEINDELAANPDDIPQELNDAVSECQGG